MSARPIFPACVGTTQHTVVTFITPVPDGYELSLQLLED